MHTVPSIAASRFAMPAPATPVSIAADMAHASHVSQALGHQAVDSHALLQGSKAVTIVHNGVPYRLQATKLGKLILTK